MTNSEIHTKAYDAMLVLIERQKALNKEHTERRKKLTAIMLQLSKARATGQTELMDTASTLTPDLADLLENPIHGL